MQENRPTKKYNGPKLFIGRLSPATTPQSLRSYFEELCSVQVVKVEYSRKSKNKKGFGYVIIDKQEDLPRLLSMKHFIDGKEVEVTPYSIEATATWYTNKAQSIKVRIGNVPDGVSEQQVSIYFERFSKVLVVNILQEVNNLTRLIENTAYLELLNTFKPIVIGKKVFSCDPELTQSVNFFSLERSSSGLSKPYSSPQIQNPELAGEFGSVKITKSLLNFELANHRDQHSKYEFIRAPQSVKEAGSNYRFNLRAPMRISAGGRPVARGIYSQALPMENSLNLI